MINNNNEAQDWFRFAVMDLDAANTLNQHMQPKPFEIICYHCQQSAEKMFKGFLVLNQVEPPKIHDLPLLCKMCIEKKSAFEPIFLSLFSLVFSLFGLLISFPFLFHRVAVSFCLYYELRFIQRYMRL